MTDEALPTPLTVSRGRAVAGALHRRPRARLALLLAGPLGWLGLAYLGSLAILFLNAFWTRDAFTGQIIRLRFAFQSDASSTFAGVYIDDFLVE